MISGEIIIRTKIIFHNFGKRNKIIHYTIFEYFLFWFEEVKILNSWAINVELCAYKVFVLFRFILWNSIPVVFICFTAKLPTLGKARRKCRAFWPSHGVSLFHIEQDAILHKLLADTVNTIERPLAKNTDLTFAKHPRYASIHKSFVAISTPGYIHQHTLFSLNCFTRSSPSNVTWVSRNFFSQILRNFQGFILFHRNQALHSMT